jgi:hypothetical protein
MVNTVRKAELIKPNGVFGSGDIGNTSSAMTVILHGMSITFISTRLNTDGYHRWQIGRILYSTRFVWAGVLPIDWAGDAGAGWECEERREDLVLMMGIATLNPSYDCSNRVRRNLLSGLC